MLRQQSFRAQTTSIRWFQREVEGEGEEYEEEEEAKLEVESELESEPESDGRKEKFERCNYDQSKAKHGNLKGILVLSSDQSLIIMTFEVELKFSTFLLNLGKASKQLRNRDFRTL